MSLIKYSQRELRLMMRKRKNNQSKPRKIHECCSRWLQNKAQTGAPRDEAKRLIPSTKSMGLALKNLRIGFAITLHNSTKSSREQVELITQPPLTISIKLTQCATHAINSYKATLCRYKVITFIIGFPGPSGPSVPSQSMTPSGKQWCKQDL